MNIRKIAIRAGLVLIGLPIVLVLILLRVFLLRFLLPELDQRHRRYHHFLRPEAGVPVVCPKELRLREAEIVRKFNGKLALNCFVMQGGMVEEGDRVELLQKDAVFK